MKEMFSGAYCKTEEGKTREFIEVWTTKHGSKYIVYGDKEYYRAIPYDCLVYFCEQFPKKKVMSKEEITEEKERMNKLLSDIQGFLSKKEE